MSAQHTPGPWRIRPSDDGPDFADINGPDWFAFARVVIRMEDDEFDSPVGIANARLIAAAPALLAALEEMLTLENFRPNQQTLAATQAARAAIAKAKAAGITP